jgi:hypothetical protein
MIDETLEHKLRTMPQPELLEYLRVASVSGRIFATIGIGSILMVLTFTNMFTIMLAGIAVFITGHMAVGVDELKVHIHNILETKDKINS